MQREQDYLFRRANQALDLVVAEAALVIAHYAGQHLLRPWVFPRLVQPSDLFTHAWVFAAFPAFLLLFQAINGAYHSLEFRRAGRTQLRNLLSVAETVAATVLLSLLTYERGVVSRALVFGAGFWLAILMAFKVAVVRRLLIRLRQRGTAARRLLVAGSGPPLRAFLRQVLDHPVWWFDVEGIVSDHTKLVPGRRVEGIPVVARLDGLVAHLERAPVDEVIFVPSTIPLRRLREPLHACELMGIRTRLVLNFHRQALPLSRTQADLFDGTALVTYAPSWEVTDWRLLVKYGIDRVAGVAALVLLSPILLALALAIKLTSPAGAPVFYRQRRCGLNGRPFWLYKFRSMLPDADARLAELRAQNEMTGPVFKMKDDPRVTPVGRWMRRWSLDELPQFWNVARGEMSLVGPRPPIPEEVADYDAWQRRRLSMKPGITCLWQVSGRNLVDFETWMKLDLRYIDTWSLWLDFKILVRTFWVVVSGYGAM